MSTENDNGDVSKSEGHSESKSRTEGTSSSEGGGTYTGEGETFGTSETSFPVGKPITPEDELKTMHYVAGATARGWIDRMRAFFGGNK